MHMYVIQAQLLADRASLINSCQNCIQCIKQMRNTGSFQIFLECTCLEITDRFWYLKIISIRNPGHFNYIVAVRKYVIDHSQTLLSKYISHTAPFITIVSALWSNEFAAKSKSGKTAWSKSETRPVLTKKGQQANIYSIFNILLLVTKPFGEQIS